MYFKTENRLQSTFFLAAISGVLLVLYFVQSRLGSVPAIKGSYILAALLPAAVVFFFGQYGSERKVLADYKKRSVSKLVVALLLLSLPLTVFGGTRILVILIIFPTVYALIGVQLVYSELDFTVLLQVIGTFGTSIITKYIDLYRFFGNGDLLGHTGRVDRLVETGSLSVLGPVYRYYPGLHVEAAELKLVTGITAYDSLLIIGITASTAAVVVIYLFVRFASGRTLAVLSAFGVSVIYQTQFFATYVFPQSLAVFFGVLIVFLSSRFNPVIVRKKFLITTIMIAAAMTVTHHFAFVLFIPIVFILLVAQWMSSHSAVVIPNWEEVVVRPRTISLTIVGLIVLGYWHAVEHFFIGQLLFAIQELILGTNIIASSSSEASVYTFGRTMVQQTPSEALASIVTPTGVYFVSLFFIFSVGIAEGLSFNRRYRPLFGALLVGIGGSLFILKTPMVLSIRLGHPFSFFFGVIVAVGLFRLISLNGRWRIVPVCLIIILGTTTPIVAGNDMYRFHDGPDFYGSNTLPEPQQTFSPTEYSSIRKSAQFIKSHDRSVTSLWMSTVALSRFGASAQDQASIVDCRIRTPTDAFFYRNKWPKHQVFFDGARNTLLISTTRLNDMTHRSSKIQTTGNTGILWTKKETAGFRMGCN